MVNSNREIYLNRLSMVAEKYCESNGSSLCSVDHFSATAFRGGFMAIKVKQKYRLANGEVCPGVTTIVQELGWNKNMLVAWANKLGLNGQESRKYVDDKASIGTLAHAFVLKDLGGEIPDTKDYTANQILLAQNCLKSYNGWKQGKKIEPMIVEKMLVSESLGCGGTPDFYGKVNDVLMLVDYKTGKGGCYPEYIVQVSAYAFMLEEIGNKVDEIRVLNIPRSNDESFSEKIITKEERKAGFAIFQHCLAIYRLKGAIKKET